MECLSGPGILDLAHSAFPSFSWAPHHHYVANQLRRLDSGETDRLIIAQPAQTSKSTICSQVFPAWYLCNHPTRNIILLSYEHDLACGHAQRARSIVEDFGHIWGVKLGKRQANAHWQTDQGGQMVSGSLMGGVTGKPADLVIIDDPIKGDEQAQSVTIRQKILREFEACCETRLSPKGSILLMNTRWSISDLTGQVLQLAEQGGKAWTHCSIPALAMENDVLGRKPGESIWEARYPKSFYEERRRQLELLGQTYLWESLYQQQPGLGAKLYEWPPAHFEGIWFTEAERPLTPVALRILALDPSKGSDSKSGDFQAFVVLDLLKDGVILCESFLMRQTIDTMVETFIHLWQERQPHACVIETGQGQQLYAEMVKEKAKYLSATPMPLYVFNQTTKKEVRIRCGLSALLAQHRIKFLKTSSNAILVGQLREFPNASFDDGPDAICLGVDLLNKLLTGSRKVGPLQLVV